MYMSEQCNGDMAPYDDGIPVVTKMVVCSKVLCLSLSLSFGLATQSLITSVFLYVRDNTVAAKQ
jgi:hypothetical protein